MKQVVITLTFLLTVLAGNAQQRTVKLVENKDFTTYTILFHPMGYLPDSKISLKTWKQLKTASDADGVFWTGYDESHTSLGDVILAYLRPTTQYVSSKGTSKRILATCMYEGNKSRMSCWSFQIFFSDISVAKHVAMKEMYKEFMEDDEYNVVAKDKVSYRLREKLLGDEVSVVYGETSRTGEGWVTIEVVENPD